MKWPTLFFTFILLFCSHSTWAQRLSDDSDLGQGNLAPVQIKDSVFRATRIEQFDIESSQTAVELLWQKNGELTEISSLRLNLTEENQEQSPPIQLWSGKNSIVLSKCQEHPNTVFKGTANLVLDGFFSIQQKQLYQLQFTALCGKRTQLIFESTSDSGQLMGIYHIAKKAWDKLSAGSHISFWKNNISFIWPSGGDYYTYNQVNLTRGDHWDVVGHELGHAIYDQAQIGAFGGGQHLIDKCYSYALALSEGWASFFSAWISLDLNDPDAKFEFMVPRRAPIRVENIPSDVCTSEQNEWRVAGFFWDLIDQHQDEELASIDFFKLWDLTFQKNARRTATFRTSLISVLGEEQFEKIWQRNFFQ